MERDHSLLSYAAELQADRHHLTADPGSVAITTVKLGGRVRFLRHVEPGLFLHAGLGHVDGDRAYANTGVAFDAGLTVDLTLLPLIDIGLHAAWNSVFGSKNLSYVTLGAQLTLVL